MNIFKQILLCGTALILVACSGSVYHNVSCTTCKAVEEEINLSADALFVFDKFSEKDLLEKGKLELNDLSEKLKTGYVSVDEITLIGHTDRLGSDKYNDRLGLNRAKTVRSYLQAHGVQTPISVHSEGERQPITNGCFDVKGKEALRNCLQPDRRVVVKVMGTKRADDCSKKQEEQERTK